MSSAPGTLVPPTTPVTARRGRFDDLALGFGLAFRGSRLRTALTAVGIGMAVAVLVFAASLPHAITAHQTRVDNRQSPENTFTTFQTVREAQRKGGADATLLANQDTTYRGQSITGKLVEPLNDGHPTPPGVATMPAPGDIVVSPALARLLRDPGNALLRERIPGRIVGTISRDGLTGPGELFWWGGSSALKARGLGNGDVRVITSFAPTARETTDTFLELLITVGWVVLLFPLAILVSTAARFGSARRDARLAALRLMGSTRSEIARIAAGESLAAAVLGLVLGALLFGVVLLGIEHVSAAGYSFFRSDLQPAPVLVAGIIIAVPSLSLGVTIFSMRRVMVEPLAVSRRGGTRRRRLWWRPLPILAGFALLEPLISNSSASSKPAQLSAGIIAVLLGVAMLPWVVEAVVRRSRGWSMSSQLAVRVLQRDAASSSRIVGGVAVAVAGAIALQSLTATGKVQADVPRTGGKIVYSTADAIASITGPAADGPALGAAIARTKGVERVSVLRGASINGTNGNGGSPELNVGTCADLRELAIIGRCHDGDTFRAVTPPVTYSGEGQSYTMTVDVPKAGKRVTLLGVRNEIKWQVPANARTVAAKLRASGTIAAGIYVTPSAAPPVQRDESFDVSVHLDPSDPLALDRVRTAAAQVSPFAQVQVPSDELDNHQFTAIRRALIGGSAVLMLLIAASLLVTTLEQLSERRRILSTLSAFGTPAKILRRALVWQIVIPVVLGLAIATIVGEGLGLMLLEIAGASGRGDLAGTLELIGVGALMIVIVTALSMPLLKRVAAPSGLRTE